MKGKTNIFDRANSTIRGAETSLVNLLSAITPWGAPLVPATMVFHNMSKQLGFEPWIATITAIVVELLGLTTVSTAMVFWQSNRKERAGYKKMPVWVPVVCFAWYLFSTLTVNVLMDAPWSIVQLVYVKLAAKTLLSTLSIPAAVTLSIRAIHEIAVRNLPVRMETSGNLPAGNRQEKQAEISRQDWRNLPAEDRQIVANMKTADIMSKYGIPERTARNWRKSAQNGNHRSQP